MLGHDQVTVYHLINESKLRATLIRRLREKIQKTGSVAWVYGYCMAIGFLPNPENMNN